MYELVQSAEPRSMQSCLVAARRLNFRMDLMGCKHLKTARISAKQRQCKLHQSLRASEQTRHYTRAAEKDKGDKKVAKRGG